MHTRSLRRPEGFPTVCGSRCDAALPCRTQRGALPETADRGSSSRSSAVALKNSNLLLRVEVEQRVKVRDVRRDEHVHLAHHRPAVPPRCTRALSPVSGPTPRGGSVTSPSSRPALLFATRVPRRRHRPGAMATTFVHEGPSVPVRTKWTHEPRAARTLQRPAAADGGRGRRQTHTRQVGTSSPLRRGSGDGAKREGEPDLI